MMNKNYLLSAFLFALTTLGFSQTTAIPDYKLEQRLVSLGIDSNGISGDILNSDASVYIGTLDLTNANIEDITGLEAFTNTGQIRLLGNYIEHLDLTIIAASHTGSLDLRSMGLVTVSMQGSNFGLITASDNTNLRYVCVDDVNSPGFPGGATTGSANQVFTENCDLTQQAYIPDNNFEQALIDQGYDTTLDGIVYIPNISGLTSLDVSGKSIVNIHGIHHFSSLITLDLSNNSITDIVNSKLNKCSNITTLDISNNNITGTLSYTALPSSLTDYNCFQNQINKISFPYSVINVNASFNNLNNVDGATSAFTHLNNPNLVNFDVSNNPNLQSVDTSNLTSLEVLNCSISDIRNLDTSLNSNLRELDCNDNSNLTYLDVSGNTNLTKLICFLCDLTSLNIKNGNNTNMPSYNLGTTGNFSLNSICVDDEAYANANYSLSVDSWTTFTSACPSLGNKDFDQSNNFVLYPNPAKSYFSFSNYSDIDSIEIFDLNGRSVQKVIKPQEKINISTLNSGIYFVKVSGTNSHKTTKLVVE